VCEVTLPDPTLLDPSPPVQACPCCLTASLTPIPLNRATGSFLQPCTACNGVFVTAQSWCELVTNPIESTATAYNDVLRFRIASLGHDTRMMIQEEFAKAAAAAAARARTRRMVALGVTIAVVLALCVLVGLRAR
jgi:hypothetical protein